MADRPLTLRITLAAPPGGVMFSLQEGDDAIVSPMLSTGADLTFDIPVRIDDGPRGLRWLGPYVRREGDRRFAYYRSGTSAGQHGSPWTRRGKIWLTDIPESLVLLALGAGQALTATFPGQDRDGGPSCATVRPLDGWSLD
jgi:hypothetical protein